MEKCIPTIDEMPCGEVKSAMEDLVNVTDEEEFKKKKPPSTVVFDLMLGTQSHL